LRVWVERSYPYVLGGAAAVASCLYHRLSVLDASQSSKMLDNVLAMSGVGLGFWSTSATLLLAVEHRSLIQRLRKGQHFRLLVGYVFAAMTSLAVTLVLTLSGMFLGGPIKSVAMVSRLFAISWFAAVAVALGTTFRAYYVLSVVLRLAASDEEKMSR